MKKLNVIILFTLLCCSVPGYATVPDKPVATKPDTLANRHPFLVASSAFALRTLYGQSFSHMEESRSLVDMADFSLAFLTPSVLGEEGVYAGATLVIISAVAKHPEHANSPIHPIIYSVALSQASNALRDSARPWIDNYSNNTALANYTSATQYLVPAVANAAPFLARYALEGNFNGLYGALTLGAGYKTVYILCEGLEKLNIAALQKLAGDQVWIEPVAQAGTGVVLSLSGYALNAVSQGLAKTLPAISDAAVSEQTLLLKYSSTATVKTAVGLSSTLAILVSEYAGYAFAAAGFKAVEKVTPEYAPYINPALGAALVGAVTQQYLWGKIQPQHAAVKSAARGAALAGFFQVFGALFKLPGWIEDAPAQLFNHIYQTTADTWNDIKDEL